MLHLAKLAVGVRDIAHLRTLQAARAAAAPPLRHHTRSVPRRAAEITAGGSIYWVVAGAMVVRQRVLDVVEDRWDDGARCAGSSPDRCRRCFPDQGAARHALRRAHLMALLHEVDTFIAPSRFLRDRFVAWGIDGARISILPNAVEAMAYTRTESAQDALYALADRVPLAVVTNGKDGALAIDATTGEEAAVPALRVPAIDPTGAGDVFDAGVTVGTLAGWPLVDRLNFASLCSALAVQQFGGSLAAPGWGDISDWWHRTRDQSPTGSASLHGRSTRSQSGLASSV